jgi:hypothetical protein
MRELLNLWGVIFPSLLIHGGVGLDRIEGHTRARAKHLGSGVYDNDRVGYLSCARGCRVPYSDGGYIVVCATFYE